MLRDVVSTTESLVDLRTVAKLGASRMFRVDTDLGAPLNVRRLLAVAALAAAVPLAGCAGKYQEHGKDAPIGARDDKPADVINMPDGYGNVAAKCHGPNMVYSLFHLNAEYGAVAVAPNDPRCAGEASRPAGPAPAGQ